MRKSRAALSALAAVLLLGGCGLYRDIYWDRWEQYERGMLIGMGSSYAALDQHNGLVHTAWGRKRISASELPEVGLFHVLVLVPAVQIKGSGSSYQRRRFVVEEVFQWSLGDWRTPPVPEEKRALTLRFDGKARVLSVGSRAFDVSKANVFVIQLDHAWTPSVRQLDAALTRRADPEAVLAVIKAQLPADDVVKDLSLRRRLAEPPSPAR